MSMPEVTIPDSDWEPTGSDTDPRSRLLASVRVNGVACHIEAFAVLGTYVENEQQRIADPYFEDEWRGICLIEPEEAMATLEIQDREYVLVAFPMSA